MFTITVTPVNDVPSFTKGANQTVNEDVTAQSVASWATAISAGPNDSGQTLTFTCTAANSALFSAQPAISTAGVLTYTPAANAYGSSTVSVTLKDNGGVANGGVDTSAAQVFTITVTPVNDAPTLTSVTTLTGASEDTAFTIDHAALHAAADEADIDSSPVNFRIEAVSSGTLTKGGTSVVGGATTLATGESLVWTPAANVNGTRTAFTVKAWDGALASATAISVQVVLTPVNDAPTLTAISNRVIAEDAAPISVSFTVADAETQAGPLQLIAATSSDPVLFPAENLVYGGTGANRTLTIVPTPNQSGVATITVGVSDGIATTTRSFTVTVTAVNDVPTIVAQSAAAIPVGGSRTIPVTVGDVETAATALILTRASGNATLLPLGGLVVGGSGADRTLTITPAAGQSGTAVVTLTVADTATPAGTTSTTVTVTVGQPPVLGSIADQTLTEDTPSAALALTVSDADTALSAVTITGYADDPLLIPSSGLVVTGTTANRTVVITPGADRTGTTVVTLTAFDGFLTGSATFQVTVSPVADPPAISFIPAQVTDEDVPLGPLSVVVSDPDSAAVVLTATSSAQTQTLLPNANLVLGGSDTLTNGTSLRTLFLTPAANQSGSATVSLTAVADGQTATSAFLVVVNAVDDPPTLVAPAVIDVLQGGSATFAVTLADPDTAITSLNFSATSANTAILPSIGVTGSGATRTVTVTPVPTATVGTRVTLAVSDGHSSTTETVLVSISGLRITATDSTAAEGGDTGTITLIRTGRVDAARSVTLNIAGSATAGADYTALPTAVTFPAGSATVLLTVTPKTDNLLELPEPETVIVSVAGDTSAGSATVSIFDRRVSIAAIDAVASEAGLDPATLRITRTGSLTSALAVAFSRAAASTAAATDYTASPASTVTIPAGSASADLVITPVQDTTSESTETLTVDLTANAAYAIETGSGSASITILDNDGPVLPVVAITASGSPAESGATGIFTITRNPASATALAVQVAVSATVPGDATLTKSGIPVTTTATIPANATSVVLTLTPIQDGTAEGDESVIVTLVEHAAYAIGTPASATLWIADDDVPDVTLTSTDLTASETGPDSATVKISRTGSVVLPMTVLLDWQGTANVVADYQVTVASGTAGYPPQVVEIPSNNSWINLTITPIDDTIIEPSETVVVGLRPSTSYHIASAPLTVTIADNDLPSLSIHAEAASVSESSTAGVVVTVYASSPLPTALTVSIARTGTAINGVDLTSIPATLTIPANSAMASLTVAPINDTAVEGDETVILTIQPPGTGYTLGSPTSATITIRDDDGPLVSISSADGWADEGTTDLASITLTRGGSTTAALTIGLTISGTATSADVSGLPSSATIPVGEASLTLPITAVTDTAVEGLETLRVAIAPGPYQIAGLGATELTITDAQAPVVTLSTTNPRASEASGTASVTITRSGATTAPLTVSLDVAGTATAGVDYHDPIPTTITLAVGAASTSRTISGDQDPTPTPEGTETITIQVLNDPVRYRLGVTTAVTLYVLDVDVPTVTVAATDATAAETTGTADSGSITVTRTGPTTTDLIVTYAVSGSAEPGTDYTALPGSITIPAGSASAVITVTPIDDTTAEASETVIVTLLPSTAYNHVAVGGTAAPGTATVTIADNGDLPVVAMTASNGTTTEDGTTGPALFSISRTGPTTAALSVVLITPLPTPGHPPAIPGSDYLNVTTVAIPIGQTSATLTIIPIQDTIAEGLETITVGLAANAAYAIDPAASQASATLIDDDVPIIAWSATADLDAIEPAAANAANPTALPAGTASATLTRGGATTAALAVTLIVSGSATAADLAAVPGLSAALTTATFPVGAANLTLLFTPIDDDLVEGAERLTLTVATPTTATYQTLTEQAITVTIADRDLPAPTVTSIRSLTSIKGQAIGRVPAGFAITSLTETHPANVTVATSLDPSVWTATATRSSGGATSATITVAFRTADRTGPSTSVDLPFNNSGDTGTGGGGTGGGGGGGGGGAGDDPADPIPPDTPTVTLAIIDGLTGVMTFTLPGETTPTHFTKNQQITLQATIACGLGSIDTITISSDTGLSVSAPASVGSVAIPFDLPDEGRLTLYAECTATNDGLTRTGISPPIQVIEDRTPPKVDWQVCEKNAADDAGPVGPLTSDTWFNAATDAANREARLRGKSWYRLESHRIDGLIDDLSGLPDQSNPESLPEITLRVSSDGYQRLRIAISNFSSSEIPNLGTWRDRCDNTIQPTLVGGIDTEHVQYNSVFYTNSSHVLFVNVPGADLGMRLMINGRLRSDGMLTSPFLAKSGFATVQHRDDHGNISNIFTISSIPTSPRHAEGPERIGYDEERYRYDYETPGSWFIDDQGMMLRSRFLPIWRTIDGLSPTFSFGGVPADEQWNLPALPKYEIGINGNSFIKLLCRAYSPPSSPARGYLSELKSYEYGQPNSMVFPFSWASALSKATVAVTNSGVTVQPQLISQSAWGEVFQSKIFISDPALPSIKQTIESLSGLFAPTSGLMQQSIDIARYDGSTTIMQSGQAPAFETYASVGFRKMTVNNASDLIDINQASGLPQNNYPGFYFPYDGPNISFGFPLHSADEFSPVSNIQGTNAILEEHSWGGQVAPGWNTAIIGCGAVDRPSIEYRPWYAPPIIFHLLGWEDGRWNYTFGSAGYDGDNYPGFYLNPFGRRLMNKVSLTPNIALTAQTTTLTFTAGFFTEDQTLPTPEELLSQAKVSFLLNGINATIPIQAGGQDQDESKKIRILAMRLLGEAHEQSQRLEVDVTIGPDVPPGLYDADIKLGEVKEYPDTASQTYFKGKDGCHRITKALSICRVQINPIEFAQLQYQDYGIRINEQTSGPSDRLLIDIQLPHLKQIDAINAVKQWPMTFPDEPYCYWLEEGTTGFKRHPNGRLAVPTDKGVRVLLGAIPDEESPFDDRDKTTLYWSIETPELASILPEGRLGMITVTRRTSELQINEDNIHFAKAPRGSVSLFGNKGDVTISKDEPGGISPIIKPNGSMTGFNNWFSVGYDTNTDGDPTNAAQIINWSDNQSFTVSGNRAGDTIIQIKPLINGTSLTIGGSQTTAVEIPIGVELPTLSEPSRYQLAAAIENHSRRWKFSDGTISDLEELPTPIPPEDEDDEQDPWWKDAAVGQAAKADVSSVQVDPFPTKTRDSEENDTLFEAAIYRMAQIAPFRSLSWTLPLGTGTVADMKESITGAQREFSLDFQSIRKIWSFPQAPGQTISDSQVAGRLHSGGPNQTLWLRHAKYFAPGSGGGNWTDRPEASDTTSDMFRSKTMLEIQMRTAVEMAATSRLKRYFSLRWDHHDPASSPQSAANASVKNGIITYPALPHLGFDVLVMDRNWAGWVREMFTGEAALSRLFAVEVTPYWSIGHPLTDQIVQWMLAQREDALYELKQRYDPPAGTQNSIALKLQPDQDGRWAFQVIDSHLANATGGRKSYVSEPHIILVDPARGLTGRTVIRTGETAQVILPYDFVEGTTITRASLVVNAYQQGNAPEPYAAGLSLRLLAESWMLEQALLGKQRELFWTRAWTTYPAETFFLTVSSIIISGEDLYGMAKGRNLVTGDRLTPIEVAMSSGWVAMSVIPGATAFRIGKGFFRGTQTLSKSVWASARQNLRNGVKTEVKNAADDLAKGAVAGNAKGAGRLSGLTGEMLQQSFKRMTGFFAQKAISIVEHAGVAAMSTKLLIQKGSQLPIMTAFHDLKNKGKRFLASVRFTRMKDATGKQVMATSSDSPTAIAQINDVNVIDQFGQVIDEFGKKICARWSEELQKIGCFPAGTLIVMADGTRRPIEKLVIGDRVMTRHDDSPRLPLSGGEVRRTFHYASSALTSVRLIDAQGGEVVFSATADHPVWSSSGGWTRAADLHPGERLRGGDRQWLVKEVLEIPSDQVVYNVEVGESNTYLIDVGIGTVWVHNHCNVLRLAYERMRIEYYRYAIKKDLILRIREYYKALSTRIKGWDPVLYPPSGGIYAIGSHPGTLAIGDSGILGRAMQLAYRGTVKVFTKPFMWASHHLIASEIVKNPAYKDLFLRTRFNANNAKNGTFLPMWEWVKYIFARHAGGHPGFDKAVERVVNGIRDEMEKNISKLPAYTPSSATAFKRQYEEIIEKARDQLEKLQYFSGRGLQGGGKRNLRLVSNTDPLGRTQDDIEALWDAYYKSVGLPQL